MNVYLYELKSNLKNALVWCMSLLLLVFGFMALYPSYAGNVEMVTAMFANLPLELQQAMGLNLKNFFTVSGFYSFLFMYLNLIASIQACNLSVGLFSKEQRMKTSDFLLTKPITRKKVFFSKLGACLTLLFGSAVLYGIGVALIIRTYSSDVSDQYSAVLLTLSLFLVQLVFVGIGCFVAMVSKRIKSVVNTSLIISFSFFMVGLADAYIKKEVLQYVSPFLLFNTNEIAINQHFEIGRIGYAMLLFVLLTAVSFFLYQKKDIHSV